MMDYNAPMASRALPAVVLRPAAPEDAEPAAALIYETLATLGEYLFGQPHAQGTIRVLTELFREKGHLLSYQFSTLAEADREVIGIAQALPSADLGRAVRQIVGACRRRFGLRFALRLAWRGFPLAFEPDTKPDEYYINTLAVAPARRNRGVGRTLLEDAERRGRELGLPVCSLSVMLHNADAKRLYERQGFRIDLKHISRLHAPGVNYSGFYRMVKPIASHGSSVKGAKPT